MSDPRHRYLTQQRQQTQSSPVPSLDEEEDIQDPDFQLPSMDLPEEHPAHATAMALAPYKSPSANPRTPTSGRNLHQDNTNNSKEVVVASTKVKASVFNGGSMHQRDDKAQVDDGTSLYGGVSVQKVGGRARLTKTPTKVGKEEKTSEVSARIVPIEEDEEERKGVKEEANGKDKQEVKHAKAEDGSKKRKARDQDGNDDEIDDKVKVKALKKDDEQADMVPSSQVDEDAIDDDGDDGAGDESFEFDPKAEIEIFDHQKVLGDAWDKIQDDMAKELMAWAQGFLRQSFREVYHAVNQYYKLNEAHQADLREGIQAIQDEENQQESAKAKILKFNASMEALLKHLMG